MTNKRKSIDQLRDIGDTIDESILGTSDAEVDEELASLGIDPEKVAAEMDAIVQETKWLAGKLRLARAKDAVSAFRSSPPNTSLVNRTVLRSRLQKMQSGSRSENDGLMMAARRSNKISPSDEEGVLDDLAQLEALEDREGSKE